MADPIHFRDMEIYFRDLEIAFDGKLYKPEDIGHGAKYLMFESLREWAEKMKLGISDDVMGDWSDSSLIVSKIQTNIWTYIEREIRLHHGKGDFSAYLISKIGQEFFPDEYFNEKIFGKNPGHHASGHPSNNAGEQILSEKIFKNYKVLLSDIKKGLSDHGQIGY